jgi:hypothetical protein
MRPFFQARSLRFRLRTLLVLIAIIAAPIAWLANTAALVRSRGELLHHFGGDKSVFAAQLLPPDARPQISWLRRWLGDLSIPSLMYDPRRDAGGRELAEALRLFPEARIRVWAGLSADGLPAEVELATDQAVGDPLDDISARID